MQVSTKSQEVPSKTKTIASVLLLLQQCTPFETFLLFSVKCDSREELSLSLSWLSALHFFDNFRVFCFQSCGSWKKCWIVMRTRAMAVSWEKERLTTEERGKKSFACIVGFCFCKTFGFSLLGFFFPVLQFWRLKLGPRELKLDVQGKLFLELWVLFLLLLELCDCSPIFSSQEKHVKWDPIAMSWWGLGQWHHHEKDLTHCRKKKSLHGWFFCFCKTLGFSLLGFQFSMWRHKLGVSATFGFSFRGFSSPTEDTNWVQRQLDV